MWGGYFKRSIKKNKQYFRSIITDIISVSNLLDVYGQIIR